MRVLTAPVVHAKPAEATTWLPNAGTGVKSGSIAPPGHTAVHVHGANVVIIPGEVSADDGVSFARNHP